MRPSLMWVPLVAWLAAASAAHAATGRVIKVLPHFLDLKGRHTLSPSLFERDAYQARLRQHPEERSTVRLDIQWKTKGPVWEPLKLRVELRGIAQGNLPRQLVLEQSVEPGGWFSHWTGVSLSRDQYLELGELTAWHISLWEGAEMLGEEKSFLW